MDRDARLRENEEVFQRANDRLRSAAEEALPDAERVPFLCECADSACMGRIDLTLQDYREVRASDRAFVMLPGHMRIAGETIIARRDGYDITEKPS